MKVNVKFFGNCDKPKEKNVFLGETDLTFGYNKLISSPTDR